MRDEQRGPLEKLAADLAATADAGLEESPAALAGLTSGIEAGKLDPAKLQLHYAAIEQTAIVRKAHEDEALDRLHAILDGPQRGAVAVRARASLEKHEKRPRFRDENGRSVPLQRILHRLDLDPAQRQKAELLLPTDDGAETYREDAKRHHEALLTTFDKEAFDATKIESNGGKNARLAAEDAVKFSAQLLPLLKTEQRERLARLLASRSYEHSRFSGVNDGDDD